MGHRLSKIYTRTGDQGSTGLGDGSRVAKNSVRVEAYGTVDELNSLIGVLLTQELPSDCRNTLDEVQQSLFDLGGELCIPGHTTITDAQIELIEQQLDALNDQLPPLKNFVLPGGSPAAAACHVARTVCRRAERRIVSLADLEQLNPAALRYLNRLSDYLFVLARVLARQQGGHEVLWDPTRGSNTD